MANKQNGAVAIFVDTPGLSPIKPILASSIGKDLAEEFYKHSVIVTSSNLQYANQELKQLGHPELDIFWSPTESTPNAATFWNEFPVILQGDGGQGEKLHHVYSTLQNGYSFVMMIYADSPHLPPSMYAKVANSFYQFTKSKDFIIGPSEYGGYYLFCGTKEIPQNIWTSIPYDNPEAINFFSSALTNVGSVGYIEMQASVDGIKDISRIKNLLAQSHNLTPEQMELRQWLNKHLK